MSILLEALRKSEKSQRSREAPTIHSEVPSGASAGSLNTVPFAFLLVLALIACGWFVWHQYRSPDGVEPVISDGYATSGQAAPPIESSNQPARNRTPMEDYQAPKQPASSAEEPGATDRQQPVKPKPDNTAVTVPPTTVSDTASEAGAAKGNTAKEEVYHPEAPAPLGYWDLPDAIRAEVPEIKFSVLVFAKNPADRFVLINGERLAEGDSHQPGLVVKEIHRDGVVFSYRLYQFLIKK